MILRVMVGVLLAGVIVIGGCAALLGSAATEIDKELSKSAISVETFAAMKLGHSERRVLKTAGVEPLDRQDFEAAILDAEPERSSCIYFNRDGDAAGLYQLCFERGRLAQKNSY